MIRVLIAEDSAAVRALLVSILSSDPEIEIIGEATTGTEVVRLTERMRPDVITMDVHMPEMSGLEATEAIMTKVPTPIVIVSSAVQASDAEMSLQAMRVGALTAMPKPESPYSPSFQEDARQLVTMVKAMSQVKVVRRWGHRGPGRKGNEKDTGTAARATITPLRSPLYTGSRSRDSAIHIVAIAASTGGPAALQQVLSALPKNFSLPILVVQHMASGFLPALATWLNSECAVRVKIAEAGEPLVGGSVYIAPDNRHLGVGDGTVLLSSQPAVGGFRPAGTQLFQSVAHAYGARAAGVIMTGMGRDGVDGLKTLRAAGGWVIAQDEASSVVYGMPQEAVRAGIVDEVVGMDEMGRVIAELG